LKETSGNTKKNHLIGDYLDSYAGYSTNKKIRYDSSSGGLVTQLLLFALESNLIDGALVTRMRRDDPLKPEPFVATTKNEIVEASKSKYCPVPCNLALSEILKKNGRFAVVGLPCHILGARKAELVNNKLRERIVLHLGLFCSHTPTYRATELLLQRMNIRKDTIVKLDYRGEGWPGYLKVVLKDGTTNSMPMPICWDFLGLDFLGSKGCLACRDSLNEFADISFGDAWLPEYSKDNLGTSILVVRSNTGMKLLETARCAKRIELSELSPEKVIQSQLDVLYSKKKGFIPRNKFLKYEMTSNGTLKLGVIDYLSAIFLCLNQYVLSKPFFDEFLKKVPMEALHAYYFVPNRLRHRMLNSLTK